MKKLLPAALAIITAVPAFSFGVEALKKSDSPRSFNARTNALKLKASNKVSSTRSDVPESVDFSYSGPLSSAYNLTGVAKADTVYLAFEIPAETANLYAGDEVTSLNITTGAYVQNGRYINLVKNVTIFTAETKDKLTYLQDATLGGDAFTEYSVKLDNPIKIEANKPLILGYKFAVPNSQAYYIPVDEMPTSVEYGALVGKKKNGSENSAEWLDAFASIYGTICMGCTIVGENYPKNGASIFDMSGPMFAELGKEFTYQFLIQGNGVSTTTLEIVSTIGESAPNTHLVELPAPLTYNEPTIVALPLQCDQEADAVNMKFEITKVNGEPNVSLRNTIEGAIECWSKDKVFPRVNLIEEGTGTWCGYCPRGIVMMDYAAEEYPELFAGAALHSGDQMSTPTVNAVLNKLFKGYPSAVINRVYTLEYIENAEIDAYAMSYGTLPAHIGFDSVEGVVDEDGNIKVDVVVKSGFDIENTLDRYRLAFYLTQDGMGPYDQANNYAGGRLGEMGGWENKANPAKDTYYNEVARYLAGGFTGFTNSLPTAFKAGETYNYSTSFPTKTVSAKEFNLIAFIVDNQTKEIANAKKVAVTNPYYSGVTEVAGDADVVARKFYDISGVEVKEPANGIYIVRTTYSDGTVKTAKAVVK